jgi:hypothetical protein
MIDRISERLSGRFNEIINLILNPPHKFVAISEKSSTS